MIVYKTEGRLTLQPLASASCIGFETIEVCWVVGAHGASVFCGGKAIAMSRQQLLDLAAATATITGDLEP